MRNPAVSSATARRRIVSAWRATRRTQAEEVLRCRKTGIGIHRLRHAHATELIDSGVSVEVVRRLSHFSAETTQVCILLAD